MLKIAQTSACNGCHACYSVCPVSAICMQSDSEGFLRPVIDTTICTECGLCEKVCPILNPLPLPTSDPRAYAAYNKNETIRLESSSGGVFTLFAEQCIREGGVVFGAKFDSDFKVIHAYTETSQGLADFRGSKYVQSQIGNTYKECKSFLEKGRKVLFSGTPCQIGGLKSFLKKEYDNLFTIDIICHGVPSPKLWSNHLAMREAQSASQIVRTSFRHKNCGWKKFSVFFSFKNNTEYFQTLDKDPYMQLFLKDVCLRPSCYACTFKSIRRHSDISLADFWGIQNILPELDDDKGLNLLLVHSKKRFELLKSFSNVFMQEVDLHKALQYNSSAYRSVAKPKLRNSFFSDIDSLSFEKLTKKYTYIPLHKKMYRLIRRVLGKIKRKLHGK